MMKTPILNKLAATFFIVCLAFTATSAMAGPDENQRMIQQQVIQAKQKLQQAKAAKGVERQGLMEEHMKMMRETLGKMRAMKPKAGMSMQEHEDWISQHQDLMEDLLGQMMEEHHLLMTTEKMPFGMGDMH